MRGAALQGQTSQKADLLQRFAADHRLLLPVITAPILPHQHVQPTTPVVVMIISLAPSKPCTPTGAQQQQQQQEQRPEPSHTHQDSLPAPRHVSSR